MKTIKEGIRHCIECLKYLSNYPPYEPESVEHGFVQGVAFAQEWISVEDELPEEPMDVLVRDNRRLACSVALYANEKFHPDNLLKHEEVTHWRPINRK